jgi:hypothetical protein
MGTTLTGLTPATTYDALIKVGDNGPLSATAKYVGDGLGNDSVVALSTSSVGIGTTSPTQLLHVAGNVRITGALYDGTNAAGTSGQILSSTGTATDWVSKSDLGLVDGSGTANFVSKWSDTDTLTNSLIFDNGTNVGIGNTSPAAKLDVTGTLAVSGNAAFDTNTLFVDAANNRVGIGTAAPADGVLNLAAATQFGTTICHTYLGVGAAATKVTSNGSYTIGVDAADGSTERMRITAAGNVGIGTTSPSGKLHISAPSGVASLGSTALAIRDSVAPDYGFDFTLEGVASGDMSLVRTELNVQSQVMTFKRSNGNVGIGTSSPEALLHVNKSTAGGEGGFIYIDNPAASTLGSSAGIKFATSSGGSFATTPTGSITNIVTNASTGASDITFGTFGAGGVGERLRITSTGNVGIGTTSPSGKLHVVDGDGQFTTYDANGYSRFTAVDASAQLGLFRSGSTAGGVYIGGNSNSFQVYTGDFSSTLLTILQASGNVGIGTASPASKLDVNGDIATSGDIILTGAKGIYFDSGGSKYLDDYEVGTWTMGVSFGGADVGVTYSSRTGSYTKVGRQVTISGAIFMTNKGSSTGDASITGLPFTAGSGNDKYVSVSLYMAAVSFADQFQGYIAPSTTKVDLRELTLAGVESGLTDANFSNTSAVLFNATYFV